MRDRPHRDRYRNISELVTIGLLTANAGVRNS